MLFFSIKLVILLASLLGYILYVYKKGIDLSFSPLITICCLSLSMFIASLLNIMPLTVIVILLGGFVLLVKNRSYRPSNNQFVVIVFFLFCYFFFAFRLKDTQVSWYDNFSHWATVVREMLKNDRLPNFSSYLIDFQSYPTGGSSFLYFVCKILGNSEGAMLFGQFLILLACVCTLFAFIKHNKYQPISIIILLLGSGYLLCVCVPITELCVDTLLSMVAIASFAFILYYRKERVKVWICTAILLTFLTLVKTSGLFFVFIHSLLLMILEFQTAKKEKKPISFRTLATLIIVSIGIPVLMYYLWNRHVSFSFYNGSLSKHSLTPAYLYNTFTSKAMGETLLIVQNFVNRLTFFEGEFTALISFLLVFLICILYKTLIAKKSIRYDLGIFIWCVLSYVFYLVGLLGMYLFAMPYDEAVILASFGRYLLSITSYIIGVTLIYLLKEMDSEWDKHHVIKLIAIFMVCFLIFATPISFASLFQGNNAGTEKTLLCRAKSDFGIPDEATCYIVGEGDYSFLYYLARYELWTGNLTFGYGPSEDSYENFIHSYEFLIAVEESEAVNRFLDTYGLSKDHRVYDLSELR